VVGGTVSERQPPLTPAYQGGESFECQVVSRRIMESAFGMTESNPCTLSLVQRSIFSEPLRKHLYESLTPS